LDALTTINTIYNVTSGTVTLAKASPCVSSALNRDLVLLDSHGEDMGSCDWNMAKLRFSGSIDIHFY